MNFGTTLNVHTTASGAADALALGTQGAGVKLATGQRNQRNKLITPKNELRIAAWNVRTGHLVGQKEIIAKELSSCKISIAALSELRQTGSGRTIIQHPSTNKTMTMFFSGGEKREAGVGFMVDSSAVKSVMAFQPISDRIAVLTVHSTIKTHFVSIYAPTEVSLDSIKDDFYHQLQYTLDTIPQTDVIILAGDFNAHLGTDRTGWEKVMGHFGYGKMNDNGLRLLTFAATNNLVIGNTHFQHPRKHQLTWRNPMGKDSAVLDYVLINSRFRSSLKDVHAMRGPDCGSDHYLVRSVIQLRLQRAKQKSAPLSKLDWTRLLDPVRKQTFQITLSNRFAALTETDDVDEIQKQISNTIMDCAQPLCPPVRRRTQPWISNECLELVDKRKRVKLIDQSQYRQLNCELRKRMKEEREAYWNQIAADLEEAASKHEYHTLYRTLRRLSGKTKSTNDNIRNADGTFVRSSVQRLKRWREFFEELYNHDQPAGQTADPPCIEPPALEMSNVEPTMDEVRTAIRSLKNGKAPGVDQITAEAVKAGGDVLLHRLHLLLQTIWRTEQVPLTWKKAIVIPVHKKGDSRDCKNYRGISLLSIVGKLFTKIIQSRLQKYREQTSREEQAGFRPNRGCCDQIFVIKQLMEERIRCGKRAVIVFIDFRSAFDCIYWPALWKALEAEFVPRKVINLLKQNYNGSSSQVRIGSELSEEFAIRTGVRQGDVVSPLLFNIVVDAIMRKVFKDRHGVQFGVNDSITDLMFADDSAVFVEDDVEATAILYDIDRISQTFGLKINTEKTKVLSTDGSPAIVHLNGDEIEQVQEFKYLGSLVHGKKVASTTEIHSRIGQAAAAFASLKWCLWKRTNISTKTKIRLFRTLILPILLYGSETWTILKPESNKLEVFQMRCLRQILHISLRDHFRNEVIRNRCERQPTIEELIQKRRLQWFGHICRMNDNRLPHRLLYRTRPAPWKIQRTAPKITWAKQVDKDLTNRRLNPEEAKKLAKDRQAWKRLVNEIQNPLAPTAAYWLRGQPRPTAS